MKFGGKNSFWHGFLRADHSTRVSWKEKTKKTHFLNYSVVLTVVINFKTETSHVLFEWYPWQFPLCRAELLT